MVGLFELFKFVDSLDQLLILTGVLCASVAGCMFPLMFYIFGDLTNAFALQAVISPEQFMDLIISVVWKMCAIGNVTNYFICQQKNIDHHRWRYVGESLHLRGVSQLLGGAPGAQGQEGVLQRGAAPGPGLV